ncbi:1-aminocyclopropane-1-carboxylate oxidase 3 [Apostasia shenzhenica]|uniref:1-aminocyclopropane-1-carboxylate oxidase 3 n=1 Tax=Apostasia shenzhenica TaxID=1088818 RepID=A0A2I0AXL2_9ASPA|nr:1-aminocyclopropane-1-carboxylate oxidase 3 [Apostasia shenzhenica]
MATSSSTAASHGGAPAPPPPTPSSQITAGDSSADTISRCFQRLLNLSPPTLSFPSRFSRSRFLPPNPPVVSLLHPQTDLLLAAASDLGLFHLTDHGVPVALPSSASIECGPILRSAPNLAALGFNEDDDDDDDDDADKVFDLGSERLNSSPAVAELGEELERVGMEVVKLLVAAGGLSEDPFSTGKARTRCLVWFSENGNAGRKEELEEGRRRFPYVVGLQYEMKEASGPWWVLGESGEWSPVTRRADSVLVTLGDIAQVWSNGRFKKVRGVPIPHAASHQGCESSDSKSISVLVTLAMDSIVAPLPALQETDGSDEENHQKFDGGQKWKLKFQSFPFADYAWRVYNERFPFKDPLLRYRLET